MKGDATFPPQEFVAHYISVAEAKKKALEQASSLLNACSKLISGLIPHPVLQFCSVFENFVPSDEISIHALRKQLNSFDIRTFKQNASLLVNAIERHAKQIESMGDTVSEC